MLPGYDLIVQAISGLMSLTGDPDGPPYRAGISVFDVMAGLHATIGILAALHHRDETGRGQHVEVNLLSSALSGHGQPVQRVRRRRRRALSGWATATRACSPTSRCPAADGELIVTAGNDGQFRKLVEVLGVPELADDPRFARNEDRTANRDELRPLLVERLRDAHRRWSGSATSSPPACRAARSTPSTAASPSPRSIGLDPVVDVGEGDAAVPSRPQPDHVLRDARADYRLPPPALDEHGAEIRALAARRLTMSDRAVPDLARHLRPPTRSGCSART